MLQSEEVLWGEDQQHDSGFRAPGCPGSQCAKGSIKGWLQVNIRVVVKIMVPSRVPNIRHLIFRVPKKGP